MIVFKASLFLCIFATFNFNVANGDKADKEVLDELSSGNHPDVIVTCQKSQSRKVDNILKEIKEASQNPDTTRTDIVTDLVQRQQNTVLSSLDKVIKVLRKLGVKFKILWISYEIFIPGATAEVISHLVNIEVVIRIRLDKAIPHIPPQPPGSQPPPQGNNSWNIGLIDARCSGIKCLGKGVTVGFIDSGVRATHVEIKDNWLGKDTPFGYMDSFANKSCDPLDLTGMGTAAVATVVGQTVGVAPEAQWMMCRSCGTGGCTESRVKICAEWLACPYECGDETEDKISKNCTMRPHVINNNWGYSLYYIMYNHYEYYFFYEYVEYWNSLGIISIFPAGNNGPGCNSIGYPAGYDNVIDVGSINPNVSLSYLSSVGPVLSTKPLTKDSIAVGFCPSKTYGNQNQTKACALIKPTVVAPGGFISSAGITSDTDFELFGGTEAAATHVTGVVALMICANPRVKWNYKLAYEILTRTTDTSRIDILGERENSGDEIASYTNLRCNIMLSNICNTYPNNMYGFGLVNACKAVSASRKLSVGSNNFGW